MRATLSGMSRLLCPEEYQQRLTDAGGLNTYDEPNFVLVWGQTETKVLGGRWDAYGGWIGYRHVYVGDGTPCWCLLEWHPAPQYGVPALYYMDNREVESGLQLCGEYPYSGKYETVQKLVARNVKDGVVTLEGMPLNSFMIDAIIPIIHKAKAATFSENKAALDAIEERKEQDKLRDIDAILNNTKLQFRGNPISYRGQRHRDTAAQKRAAEMSRYYDQAVSKLSTLHRGFQQA